MKVTVDDIVRIIRLLKPEPRKWIVRVLGTAAVGLIASPVWEPYAKAVLAVKFNIVVPPSTSYAGWVLLILTFMMIGVNYWIDNRVVKKELSDEYISDKKSVVLLFNEIHRTTLDELFSYAEGYMIYLPAQHFCIGVQGVVNSSGFYVHDEILRSKISDFIQAFTGIFTFYSYFTETSSPDLQKFNSRFSIYSDPNAKKAHDDFHQCANELESSFKSLCTYVNTKFPGFDFSETDKVALRDYIKYNTMPEKDITDFEFAVVGAVVNLEENNETPSLERLGSELSKPKVDVQVALDKLIKIGFVSHLYKGMPHQKYTLLDAGRAYYVKNRDEIMQFDD